MIVKALYFEIMSMIIHDCGSVRIRCDLQDLLSLLRLGNLKKYRFSLKLSALFLQDSNVKYEKKYIHLFWYADTHFVVLMFLKNILLFRYVDKYFVCCFFFIFKQDKLSLIKY